MAYNEEIAERIAQRMSDLNITFEEKKMFGGLGFLYKGKMTVGVVGDEMAVRILSPHFENQLEGNPYVRPMDFTKRPMKEFVFVGPDGFKNERDLDMWIDFGLKHARSKLEG